MVSILIPAREEKYLEQTIRNVLANSEGEIEILVALDGYLPNPPFDVKDNRVIFYPFEKPIGQRASINFLARQAKGKFIMKLDAHCAVDKGFDIKLSADCEYDWTVIPRMYNLDFKTWLPKDKEDFTTAVRRGKLHDYISMGMNEKNELRTLYYPHDVNKKLHHERKDILIDDTLSCMGCCFFMHKDRFFEQGGCDENHEGGWGQQAIEVACKAWLSGGSLKVNKKTWFAHWFRGDIGFPYQISGNQIDRVRAYSTDLWLNDKWDKATRKFQWLLDKFDPPNWKPTHKPSVNTGGDLTVIFLTMNKMPQRWVDFQMKHLRNAVVRYPVISVSRLPMDLGHNLIDDGVPSFWNMYMKILDACKIAKTPYVAIAEDDTLYTKEHFTQFRPPMDSVSFDRSRWSLFTWDTIYCLRQRVSNCSCIAPRQLLIDALEERKKKYPNGCPDKLLGEVGRASVEKRLGVSIRKSVDWYCNNPIVQLNHPTGNDKGDYGIVNGRHMIKKHGQIKAVEIPYWGKAVDIIKEYA
jgi:glycosyltransferase involved in cell wall biosynthesis